MSDINSSRDPIELEESGAQLDLRGYARVLLKRKWIILATMAVLITATVFWTLRQPKLYVATASIVINPKAPEVLGAEVQEVVQLGSGGSWFNEDYYNTQLEILTSRRLATMTVLERKLHENPKVVGARRLETSSKDERIEIATRVVMGALSVKKNELNRIFKIRMTHADPEIAAFLANSHVDTYIKYTLSLRTEGTEDASKYLSDELDAAERSLREAELELHRFKRENDILSTSLEDDQNLVSGNIERYTNALNDAKTQRIQLESLRRRIKAIEGLDPLISPIFKITESTAGQELKTQYYAELKKLTELSGTFGEKAPEYRQQKQKVDNLYSALKAEATLAAAAIDQRYQALLDAESAYKKELDAYRKQAFELNEMAVDYNPLARREKSDEEKYVTLLARMRTSDLSSRLKTVNIKPLDPALVPGAPSFPRMDRNVALAAALSLFLGIGIAFLLEYLDRTIKTTEDVENNVGAPVLGIIPLVPVDKGLEQPGRDLLVFREPTSRAAECCRQIRTNLLFMSADHQFETLVVSSPNPREGKSTTVMYLATTMAQSGQRVLVIDSDMRRPRLHKAVGATRTTGLSNLIVGEATADDVVKTTDIPNLYFLPCGPTPPNPAELLMTDRFREVLGELRDRFDRIILDSPPILAVTDALVMSKLADGVVLVMKAGSTTRDDARSVARQLGDVGARVAGVVLNELDLDDKSYGYNYHYYGYSYGSSDSDKAGEAA